MPLAFLVYPLHATPWRSAGTTGLADRRQEPSGDRARLFFPGLDIGKEIVQTLCNLGITARTNGLLEHLDDEPVPGLATRLRGAVDGCEEVVTDCDPSLSCPRPSDTILPRFRGYLLLP